MEVRLARFISRITIITLQQAETRENEYLIVSWMIDPRLKISQAACSKSNKIWADAGELPGTTCHTDRRKHPFFVSAFETEAVGSL